MYSILGAGCFQDIPYNAMKSLGIWETTSFSRILFLGVSQSVC